VTGPAVRQRRVVPASTCPRAALFLNPTSSHATLLGSVEVYFDHNMKAALLAGRKFATSRTYTVGGWGRREDRLREGHCFVAHTNWGDPDKNRFGFLRVLSITYRPLSLMTADELAAEGLIDVDTVAAFALTKYCKGVPWDKCAYDSIELHRATRTMRVKRRMLGYIRFEFSPMFPFGL
jgi:hypothetical protein